MAGRASAAGTHWHLWLLSDGSPSHAPPGRLSFADDGQVICHLCGGSFHHLGLHLRVHGWTPGEYWRAVGLSLRIPLCSVALSSSISARQKAAWDGTPLVRARFEAGQQMARSGELQQRSADMRRRRKSAGDVRAAPLERTAATLAAGRKTQQEQRRRRLAAVAASFGAPDLHAFLRHRYELGASLEVLREATGLGREQLRTQLIAAGVASRRVGEKNPESRRARSVAMDRLVQDRVGASDICQWLRQQRTGGATLRALAVQTGRSVPWVQSRLRDISSDPSLDGCGDTCDEQQAGPATGRP